MEEVGKTCCFAIRINKQPEKLLRLGIRNRAFRFLEIIFTNFFLKLRQVENDKTSLVSKLENEH